MSACYGADLARLHHDHFGMVADAAARELLRRLEERGVEEGLVVDLAAGSGILSHHAAAAGFDVLGVDLSEDMLDIARAGAPRARFVRGSLWDVVLPACVAVAAVGEALCYAADPRASLTALEGRFATIRSALAPGGLLLFDVASPGRSGPTGTRCVRWEKGGTFLSMEERESALGLTRRIDTFVPAEATPGGDVLYRRAEETHTLRLYDPDATMSALERAGFSCERLPGYDDFRLPPGWNAFAATKPI
jgi:SAM-dependent methyltransferase